MGGESYSPLLVSVLIVGVVVESRQAILEIAKQDRAAKRYERRVATYQEIGEAVDHSRRTLLLVNWDYGYSLAYHGWLAGEPWPYPVDLQLDEQLGRQGFSIDEHFDTLYSEHSPEYFIITRKWWEDEEHEDLRNFLTENFPMTAQEDDYVVFDLREKG